MKWRYQLPLLIITLLAVIIGLRLIYINLITGEFLQAQGQARHARVVEGQPKRGVITDRYGIPLAISTKAYDIWIDPAKLDRAHHSWYQALADLQLDPKQVNTQIDAKPHSRFMYLKRQVSPQLMRKLQILGLRGLHNTLVYKRYYPNGEVTAQLLGYTNIDGQGQEGIEFLYDNWLSGAVGVSHILQDRYGLMASQPQIKDQTDHGKPIALSIDRRIQFIAYQALKRAVRKAKAKAGAAVVLDSHTGEILALVNQPAFNPNDRSTFVPGAQRNRALTDVFEPGSVMKPFAMLAALEAGTANADTIIDTSPGYYRLGRNFIKDERDYGQLSLRDIIQKSSNVGISKLVVDLPPETLPNLLSRLGFGQPLTDLQFPSIATGKLLPKRQWRNPMAIATLSFGYGISTSLLQLAQAYSTIANDGYRVDLTLLKRQTPAEMHAIVTQEKAKVLRELMHSVTQQGGTGAKADVDNYHIAGKTGTSRKAIAGGYAIDRYVALFAGMAPASNPRLVMLVMIDDPSGESYYGGDVAAPAFRETMQQVLPILNIQPDEAVVLFEADDATT